jgi:hypothetical protein
MIDLAQLLTTIDELSPDELETVYRHVTQRRQSDYWLIPGEQLKAIQTIMEPVYRQTDLMTEAEINEAIDEALNEVRLERHNQTHHRD